jgi:hypothetical protein
MKTTTINLLSNKEDYYAIQKRFYILRITTLILTFCLLAYAGVLAFYFTLQNNQVQNLLDEKQKLLSQTSMHQTDQAKLLLLSKKLQYFQDFSRDDAQFTPYYNLLLDTLKTSSQSGTLTDFQITKDRHVSFILKFSNIPDMLASFSVIESPTFLKNFLTLKLNDFTGTSSRLTAYELSFEGIFIPLDAIK